MKRPIVEPSEHLLQVRLLKLLAYMLRPELRVIAIPNQGKRSVRAGMKMRAEGLTAGAPDLLFLFPADEGSLAWLEMKTTIGRLRDNQIAFRAICDRLHHRWAMARSVDEALDVLRGWNALKPNAVIL